MDSFRVGRLKAGLANGFHLPTLISQQKLPGTVLRRILRPSWNPVAKLAGDVSKEIAEEVRQVPEVFQAWIRGKLGSP